MVSVPIESLVDKIVPEWTILTMDPIPIPVRAYIALDFALYNPLKEGILNLIVTKRLGYAFWHKPCY